MKHVFDDGGVDIVTARIMRSFTRPLTCSNRSRRLSPGRRCLASLGGARSIELEDARGPDHHVPGEDGGATDCKYTDIARW